MKFLLFKFSFVSQRETNDLKGFGINKMGITEKSLHTKLIQVPCFNQTHCWLSFLFINVCCKRIKSQTYNIKPS